MLLSPLVSRTAALALLLGALFVIGDLAEDRIEAYADGQHDIDSKRAELRDLRDLAQARAEFRRLVPRAPKTSLIMPSADGAQEALSAQIRRAADGRQIIVDSIEALPTTSPTLVTANVRIRGTQDGVYTFLRALEDQTPYLIVPRIDLSVARVADLDQNKPLILSTELRVAALVAPSQSPLNPAPPPGTAGAP